MFGKKKYDFTWEFIFEGCVVKTDSYGYDVLQSVRRQMFELKSKNMALKAELDAIKPVVESPDYKPPKSKDCCDCEFAVYSPWDNVSVIGCRKDSLCEDFKPKKEK